MKFNGFKVSLAMECLVLWDLKGIWAVGSPLLVTYNAVQAVHSIRKGHLACGIQERI